MRKKLLLADDSITIQKVVELTFPSDEFEVVTAGNGRLAVDKALAFLPDIVLCDVIMPQLDGYQVCEALRASPQLADVPILLLNGAFEPYDADRARSVGALGNVSKPFDPPALVARVKEILSQRSTGGFKAPDASKAAEGSVAEAAAPHEYTYDESETHPVSTVEVPMDVRELAARSLSLDVPVFAPAEPEVLTEEEPSDFAETLHGPLDADVPPAIAETESDALETTETEPPDAPVEAIEAIDEIHPVAVTGEFETPGARRTAAEAAATEPMEFDEEPAESSIGLPPSPMRHDAAIATHSVGEFSGEHEFDPSELDASVDHTPEAMAPEAAPEPEAMTLPEELKAPEPEAVPLPVPAPKSPSPAPAVGLPAPAPAQVAAPAGAFSSLVNEVAALVPDDRPRADPAGSSLPSSEVAVPVDMVKQIAQRVISQVSERVIREIAWDVIPGMTEKLIKAEIERIKARAESESD